MEQTQFLGTRNINGNDIYYEYYKNDSNTETVLLIHGFLSSTFSFRRLIPLLRENYNIISVDFPPFGKSGKNTGFIYSYKNTAETLTELIQQLGLDKISVIGHSMGGQISLQMIHLHPELISKAVLLSSSSYLKRPRRSLILSSYLPFFHLCVKLHLARSGVKWNLNNVVFDHSIIDDEMVQGYLAPFLQNEIFKALTRMLRQWEGDLSEADLREIQTPCLLIWGEHDKVVPLSVGKRLHHDLKNSELIILKETGHLVPEERADDVFQYIEKFLLT